MKLSLAVVLLAVSGANAFAPLHHRVSPSSTTSTTSSELNLFGGGSKSGDSAAKKGPGMMDQLAMFKKAAEMAQKKNNLDQELAAETFEGSSENGKVTVTCKFVPSKSPMDPQPEYQATAFEFDEEWYESASPEDLSAAVKEAIKAGTEATSKAAAEKYKVLEEDLKGTLGALGGAAPGGEAKS